MLRCW